MSNLCQTKPSSLSRQKKKRKPLQAKWPMKPAKGMMEKASPNQCSQGGQPAFLREGTGEGGRFQITKSCLVSDKYRSEVALKIDTVKRGLAEGGSGTPNPPTLPPLPPGYEPGSEGYKIAGQVALIFGFCSVKRMRVFDFPWTGH